MSKFREDPGDSGRISENLKEFGSIQVNQRESDNNSKESGKIRKNLKKSEITENKREYQRILPNSDKTGANLAKFRENRRESGRIRKKI